MKKKFKITKNEFKVTGTYPAFKIGTDTDSDVLARMAGIEDSAVMAVCNIEFERKNVSYQCKIEYRSTGEQSLNITKEGYSRLENDANNCELTKEEDILKMAHLIENGAVNFDNNCWYEGEVTITTGGKIILSGYESEFGLDGVQSSIQEIQDSTKDIKTTIEFLMEELWEDPSNAEIFIDSIKE
jgi:hypothetical protein